VDPWFKLQGLKPSAGQEGVGEPQNTEQGIMNVEGKKTSSFEIPCSIFDIQNRKDL
jgi:hypothetical protein